MNIEKLGTLRAAIEGDVKDLTKGIALAKRDIKSFGKGVPKWIKPVGAAFVAAGAVITTALGKAVLDAGKFGDSMDKMSLRTGVGVEALSELAFATKISGSDVNALETSIRFLNRRMDEAGQGIGIAVDAFEKLGVEVLDSDGKMRSSVEVMSEVADGLVSLTAESERGATAMDIFGARSGPQLLPLLKAGSAGIQELRDRARELGLTMSTESAKAAADFEDALTELGESAKMAKFNLGQVFLPVLTEVTDGVTKAAGWFSRLSDTEQEIVGWGIAVSGAFLSVNGAGLLLIATLPKIAVGFKLLGIGAIGSGLALAATSGLTFASALWAVHRVYKALMDPTQEMIGRMKGISKANKAAYESILVLEAELERMNKAGWDPALATLGDMNINLQEFADKLGILPDPMRNAHEMIRILEAGLLGTRTRAKETTEAIDDLNTALTSLAALDKAGELWFTKTYPQDLPKRLPMGLDIDPAGRGGMMEYIANVLKAAEAHNELGDSIDANRKKLGLDQEDAKYRARAAAEHEREAAAAMDNVSALNEELERLERERQTSSEGWDERRALLEKRDQARLEQAYEEKRRFADQDKLANQALLKEREALLKKANKQTKKMLSESEKDWTTFNASIKDDFKGLFDDMLDPSVTDKWNNFWRNLTRTARNYMSDMFTGALFQQFMPAMPYGYGGGGGGFRPGGAGGAGVGGIRPPQQMPYTPVGTAGPMPPPKADPVAAFLASLELAGMAKGAFFGKTPDTLTGYGYLDEKLNAALQLAAYKQGGMLYPGQGQRIADLIMQQTPEAEALWLANQAQWRQTRPQGEQYGYGVENPNLAPGLVIEGNLNIVLPDIQRMTPAEIEDTVSQKLIPAIRSAVKRGRLNRSILT